MAWPGPVGAAGEAPHPSPSWGEGEVPPAGPPRPGVTGTWPLTPPPASRPTQRSSGDPIHASGPSPTVQRVNFPHPPPIIRSFRAAVFPLSDSPSPDQSEYTIRTAQRAGSTLISACSVHRQALTRLLEQSERPIQSLNYQNCQSGGTRVRVRGCARHSSTGPRA